MPAPSAGTAAPSTGALLLFAYVSLSMALALSLSYHPASLALVLLALGATLLAARVAARPTSTPGDGARARLPRLLTGYRMAYAGLALLAVGDLINGVATPEPQAYTIGLWIVTAAALVLLGVHAGGDRRWQRVAVTAIVGAKLALLFAAPLAVPSPWIDVWHLQQDAVANLLQGRHPYTTPSTSTYQGHSAFGDQTLYSYAPLNLLLSVPSFVLLGDYRYGLAACFAGSLLLWRAIGRRMRVDGRWMDIILLALVLHPRLERLVIHGWHEPYLMLVISIFVLCQLRAPVGMSATLTVLSLPLFKQYFAVPVLLYFVLLRPRTSAFVAAATVGTAIVAPLLIWNYRGTVDALLHFVLHVQFRPDSISIAAALAPWTAWRPGGITALIAQLLVGAAAALWMRQRNLGGYLHASAAALLAGFLVAPQAFINYYFFVGVVLLLAALTGPSPLRVAEPGEGAAAASPSRGRPVLRAVALSLVFAAIVPAGTLIYFQFGCQWRSSRARARLAGGAAVLDTGVTQAGNTDEIFLCAMPHCASPNVAGISCHEDLKCICVPMAARWTAGDVERRLAESGRGPASCTLDEPHPSLADDAGACRRGRCHEELAAEPGTQGFGQ